MIGSLGFIRLESKKNLEMPKKINLIWHYLIFDKEFTSTRSDAQLKDLKKGVLSLIKTIEKDTKFSPLETKLCDWCEYPEYCPAKKHEAKVEALPLEKYLKDNGVTLVNKYASIKAKIRELKEKEARASGRIGFDRRGLNKVCPKGGHLHDNRERSSFEDC